MESTFTSVADLGAELYPLLPVRALARIRYDSLSRMPRLHCPVLVIHGRDDELKPYAHGPRLFAAAGQPKSFLDIPGGHNAGKMLRDPAYREALDAARGAPPNSYSQ